MRALTSMVAIACWASLAAAEQAKPADAFIDTIGVNTHLNYYNTVYGDFSGVIKPRLRELGLRHIRDGINNDDTKMDRLQELYRDLGIRSCLIASPRVQTPAQSKAFIVALGPALVTTVEGENEPNLNLGSDWVARTRTHQRDLYAAFNGDAATRNIPIAGPSVTEGQDALGSLTDALDYGNIHNYYGGHHPESGGWGGNGYGSVSWSINYLAKPVSGTKPIVATETGYHDSTTTLHDHRGTDPAVIARYMPRLFLYHFNRGIVRSFPYELIDQWVSPGDPESCFGLLHNDGTPKPSFHAMKNLITLLRDPGASFTPGSLDLAWSGATANVHHTLLQKRDGVYYLAVWLGLSGWDADDRSTIAVPAQRVNIAVGGTIASVDACLPNNGTTWSTRTLSGGTVSVNVDDRVLLLRLTPAVQTMRINFQPASAPRPSGWSVDSGAVYADRGGLTYGWNALNDSTRDRNDTRSADQVRDTLIHLQKPANPNAQWEIAVANGTYQVTLVAGDAAFTDSRYAFDIEGSLALDATTTSSERWVEASVTRTVSDGRLTVRNAGNARNNKLCSIEIIRQPASDN